MTIHSIARPKQSFDFSPSILAIEQRPPSPLPRVILGLLIVLSGTAITWATVGQIDIIATAPGKLIPTSYLQIVQPAEGGVLKEILVREGDTARAGQVLARMNANLAQADQRSISNELAMRRLQLRRVDAELQGNPLRATRNDPGDQLAQANSQYQARRQAHRTACPPKKPPG